MDLFSGSNVLQDAAEIRAINQVIDSFLYYRNYYEEKLVDSRLSTITKLSEQQRELLGSTGVIKKIKTISSAVHANYSFFLQVVAYNPVSEHSIDIADTLASISDKDQILEVFQNFFQVKHGKQMEYASIPHLERLKSALNMMVRDWSSEGSYERNLTYAPILRFLKKHFPAEKKCDRSNTKILVPGAGLGRLAFEIASLDFYCQGNEFSYLMLIVSNYILNFCTEPDSLTVYPFVHDFSNVMKASDQFRKVTIPDVAPCSLLSENSDNFSMAGGDFLEIYKNDYGGLLINVGPLLWHYENNPNECSIELTFEEYLLILQKFGFILDFEESDMNATTPYSLNHKSMLTHQYKTPMVVAYKPLK
ncbi:hypothetical protein BB561_004185 [Smittium simulii]|uniref:carnosine N-methyltransferase n=1 Tax=Smittium simulii TaxID=133385 RepID=A0A2T9YHJ7_9FUNG|nr:hypothetical protein BB561_004185 [Smittium simulii]